MMFPRLFGALLCLVIAVSVCAGADAQPADSATEASSELSAEAYQDWEKVAQRAEMALSTRKASTVAFDQLRSELTQWRAIFNVAQDANEAEIATLEARISALGKPPEEGETESGAVAARRAELTATLDARVAPVVAAREAYTRANGLIFQIDSLIRERLKQRLFERGPTPIDLSGILGALEDIHTVWRIVATEVDSSFHLKTDRTLLKESLPVVIGFTAIALFLLFRGRPLFQRLVNWIVRRQASDERTYVVAMIVSSGQFLVPVLGLTILVWAVQASAMLGAKGEALILVVPRMGLAFFGARWLGGQTFPRLENWPCALDLSARERVRGRFYLSSLGVLVAVAILIVAINQQFILKPGTPPVVTFPIFVLTALCLAGIGRLLISHGRKTIPADSDLPYLPEESDERTFLDGTILLLGRACIALSVVGPLLALVGYTRAAIYFTLAPGLSLGLLAVVLFLQRLSMGIFAMFGQPAGEGRSGLWSVLVNFAIVLAALPFFAMIWGVRKSDLLEFWTLLQNGISIGETQISLEGFLVFATVFLVGSIATRMVKGAMRNSILPRTRMDEGAQKAVVSGLGYLGILIAALLAVSVAGFDLSGLAIVAGALSVGVGFGLQNIVSNFVSGLILLIERPVTEGDWIEVGGIMGTVRKISVRATTVETFDRTSVIVPNSDFVTGQVTNWTRGNLAGRLILPVGVAYGSNTRKVAQILQEVAEEHPLVIVNPPPQIVFQGFGADSLDFEMRVILRDINFGLGARTELNHRIAERFAEDGIEVPFAQRDIWLRNPEALRGGPVPDVEAAPVSAPARHPDYDPGLDTDSPSEDDT